MLTTDTRLKLEDIGRRIAFGQEVSFQEMTFITKWSKRHAHARKILNQARRRATMGEIPEGGLDEFLDIMDLGNPDPQSHLTSENDVTDIAQWFSTKKEWFEEDGRHPD